MEYLKDKYCYQTVTDIWTASPSGADPFQNNCDRDGQRCHGRAALRVAVEFEVAFRLPGRRLPARPAV